MASTRKRRLRTPGAAVLNQMVGPGGIPQGMLGSIVVVEGVSVSGVLQHRLQYNQHHYTRYPALLRTNL